MKRTKLLIMLGVMMLLLLAVPAGTVLAAPAGDILSTPFDRIITGDNYTLRDGEVEEGNVVVLGGSVEIEAGARLEGDLMVMGGSVEIAGLVEGNVVVMGGNVDLLGSAVIEGDFALVGGNASIDQEAVIEGDTATNPQGDWFPFAWEFERDGDGLELPRVPEIPTPPRVPEIPALPRVVYHYRPSFASKVGGAFLSALGMGVVALLVVLFWPKQSDRVRGVLLREPATSGLVGFLTFLAAGLITPVLVVISLVLLLICIGLLGFPLIALMWLAVVLAVLFGYAAAGLLVGRWVGRRLGLQGMTPMLEAALGVFTVKLALGIVQAVPLIGIGAGLLEFVVVCVALGAVVLTRFGTRDYQQGQPILPRRPSAPAPPAAPVAPVAPAGGDEGERFAAPPLEIEGPFPEE